MTPYTNESLGNASITNAITAPKGKVEDDIIDSYDIASSFSIVRKTRKKRPSCSYIFLDLYIPTTS